MIGMLSWHGSCILYRQQGIEFDEGGEKASDQFL